ncbi:MAG TPA: hypothetical protein VGM06_15740 [Polyangiaceae bacterium]
MSKCYYGCVARFECFAGAARVTSRQGEPAVVLATPPIARIVPDGVFDDFAWCESDDLAWRCPAGAWDGATRVDGADPARMVFVVRDGVPRDERQWVPRELARLHAFGLGLGDEEALAPWAIDDATDGLHARRVRPSDLFWLAADNLNALFWGLHDWAHFHNHGPFTEVAWTELQCDASALAWLWRNRALVPLEDAAWERLRSEVEALCAQRFAAEGAAMPPGTLARDRVHALVAATRAMRS